MSNIEHNSYNSKPEEMHWLDPEGGTSSQELHESLVRLPVEDNQLQFDMQGDLLHPDTFLESANFPDITISAAQAQKGECRSQTQFDILHTIDGIIPVAQAEISKPTAEWRGSWDPEDSTADVQGKRKAGKRKLEQVRESSAEPTPSSQTQPRPTANRSLKRRRTSKDDGPVAEAGNANSYLTPEEKRKIRAERNRESAEKSRMRQKKKTEKLESDVYELRKENCGLMEASQEISTDLKGSLEEIQDSINKGDVVEDTVSAKVKSLREALAMIKQAEEDCPWTFQAKFYEQEIPLKLKPSPQQPGSPQSRL